MEESFDSFFIFLGKYQNQEGILQMAVRHLTSGQPQVPK